MAYWYRVQTICAATIREAWTILSDTSLTRAAIESVIAHHADVAPSVSCLEEETRVEEAERVVFNVVSMDIDAATQRRH
jgi:hypothetical protein